MQKRAFTLIEMMVVMALIAIFSLLGATGFVAYRDQQILESATQGLLTSIRETQNAAISVKKVSGQETKAWAIKITDNQYSIRSYYPNESNTNLLSNVSEPAKNLGLVKIATTLHHPDLTFSPSSSEIVYTSPFSSSYISVNSCPELNICPWNLTPKVTKEWEPVPKSGVAYVVSAKFRAETKLLLRLSYKNQTKTIVVGTNGDAYVQ